MRLQGGRGWREQEVVYLPDSLSLRQTLMGLGLGQDLFTSLNNKLRESYEGKAKKNKIKKKLLLSSDFLLRISISNCKHPPL